MMNACPTCRICGRNALRFAFREANASGTFEQWRCRACGASQTIGEFAAVSPDYVALTAEDLTPEHRFLQTKHKAPAFNQWRDLMARHSIRGGRLLDIGCGVGGFLDYAASLGFETFGFDASSAQARSAAERHHNVCHAIDFDAYEAARGEPTPNLDVVTMWDVFEHIRDPQPLLAGIRARLRPGGLLFISVPGGGLNSAKVMLRKIIGKPPGLIPWEHVFYHSPRSLKTVLANHGFHIVEQGGVVPYVREPGPIETVRQITQRLIADTPLALQLYAVGTPA